MNVLMPAPEQSQPLATSPDSLQSGKTEAMSGCEPPSLQSGTAEAMSGCESPSLQSRTAEVTSGCESPSLQSRTAEVTSGCESPSLQSGKAEVMDASTQDSSPAQRIRELDQLYNKHKETGPPSLSRAQHLKKKKVEESLAQYREGPREVQKSHQHELQRLQKELDHLNREEQQHPWYKKHRAILMAYCKPELATLIPPEIIELLQDLLISEDSILNSAQCSLINILNSTEDFRKVIKNNRDLDKGKLTNMNGVVFKHACSLTSPFDCHIPFAEEGDYSDISFQSATFPSMHISAIFSRCDFSHANFTGTNFAGTEFAGTEFIGTEFIHCDFRKANFTGTCFTKCWISCCNFDQATLKDVDFSDLGFMVYNTTKGENLSNTIDLLYQAIIEYTGRDTSHRTAAALRSLVHILQDNKQPEKAEEVYGELLQRQQAEIADFMRMGEYYLRAAFTVGDEKKTQMTGKGIAWLQKGWQKTSDTPGEFHNHSKLFITAMHSLPDADSSFDWRSVLNDIKKSKGAINDAYVLRQMAQLLIAKQADGEAMEILKQLAQDSQHDDQELLANICNAISAIERRNRQCNKALSAEAQTLLDKVRSHPCIQKHLSGAT